MFVFPSNILPIFVIGIIAILFGIRSIIYYNKVRSPLFKYLGWGTILFGMSSLFLVMPYIFTPSSDIIKIIVTISNILYIAALFIMFRIIWYLGFRKSISYYWMFWPVLILSMVSLGLDLQKRVNADYYLAGNIAYYSAHATSTYILALLSLSIVVVGILTIRQANEITEKIQRNRIKVIGMMFLLAGLVVEYNFLFNKVQNSILNSIVALIIDVILVGILIFFTRHKVSK